MFKLILLGFYSVLITPFMLVSIKFWPKAAFTLSKPLLNGPMKNEGIVNKIDNLVFRLERKEFTPEEFIKVVSDEMRASGESGELNKWLSEHDERDCNVDITLKRKLFYLPLKWWYLKIHFMKEGNKHGLHAHRNVLSTQVVLRGKLKIKEYDRISSLTPPTVDLIPLRCGDAEPGDTLMSTDKLANVHGFEPYPEGAVRFQFYLRGHTSLFKRFPKRGRLYINLDDEFDNPGVQKASLGRTGRPGES